MTVNKQLQKYYTDYIYDFNKEIIKDDTGEINEFEINFPYDPEEMRIFIEVFESIFPKANHKFFNYIKLLEGLNIMEESEDFKNTDMFIDIVDYIRNEALEELTNQISDYPKKIEVEKKYFDFKGYIEEINEKLGFDGMNSEIIHDETGEFENYDITIEGNNFTTLQINLEHQKLEKHLKNRDLEKFILKSYEAEIVDFDTDEKFDELYDAVSPQYRASEFLKMLEEDKIFFTNTIIDAID